MPRAHETQRRSVLCAKGGDSVLEDRRLGSLVGFAVAFRILSLDLGSLVGFGILLLDFWSLVLDLGSLGSWGFALLVALEFAVGFALRCVGFPI